MPSTLFTLGYAQWSIDEVATCVADKEAVLVDVRHAPHTTKPGFSKSELSDRFGPRYRHVPGFGNVNYREGPIELADPERGRAALQDIERPIILMCGCQSPQACHRSTVASLLRTPDGDSPIHLRSPTERAQPDLFEE